MWGGALADRVSRKALMIYPRLIQGLALAAVALLAAHGRVPVAALVAASAVSGLASGVSGGAAVPALRRIVPTSQVAAASAQQQGRDAAAQLIGGPLGGFLFAVARWMPFLGDAISFGFSALGAALIRTPLGPDVSEEPRQSMLADVREGMRYTWREPFLRFTALWAAGLNFVGMGFGLVIIFTLRALRVGPTGIGFAMALVLVAMVISSVLSNTIVKHFQARLIVLTVAVALPISLALIGLADQPWEIVGAAALTCITIVPINAVLESYMVALVPDELLGRVSAVDTFISLSLGWLGMIAAGVFAQAWGAAHGALVFAALVAAMAVPPLTTKSLDVLRHPVEQVEPFAPPEPRVAAAPV